MSLRSPWTSPSIHSGISCNSTMARLQSLLEAAVLVEHIGDAAGHAGREIASGLAEHDDDAAGHVFAAVVAGALDHDGRAGIAHREPLAGDAAEVALAGDRAVEHGVADDDRLLRHAGGIGASA